MTIAISPIYIKLTHRYISNICPKSRQAISKDTGITVDNLNKFASTKRLDPKSIMKLWNLLFPNTSFLEASVQMDNLGFERT